MIGEPQTGGIMFSHIMVGANDIAASKAFYDATFAAMGVTQSFTDDKGRVFWMAPTGIYAITKPIDGQSAGCGNGSTIGLAMESPAMADAWHAAGLASGGTAIEDPPGPREGPTGKLYLAYLRDPAGNKLCALHRMG
jgi:catechol 2,3-dioxygenase-like lactoylglutathione lyase family enzyme